jgi:hypothetical protein
MATNFYFNNFPKNHITPEQLLVEDLVIEAMQIYGMDVFYMPRSSRDSVDQIYGEDTLKTYRKAYPIEMYMENVTGMDGEQDFISKFGLEIRDELTMLVSRRRFKYSTGAENLTRPREGDLVYVPLVQNFFEITFVEHENDQAMFHTLGRGRGGNVYVYALKMKQFVFSEEVIETGIEEIDEQIRDAYKKTLIYVTGAQNRYVQEEIVYQGEDVANSTAQAVVYSYTSNSPDYFLEVTRVRGTFAANVDIIGATSNTRYKMVSKDDMTPFDNINEDIADNNLFEKESEGLIDFSEFNPFSEVVSTYRISMDSSKVTMDNLITNSTELEKVRLFMDNEDF